MPWKEYTSDRGRPYYHNPETGETTWTIPAEMGPPSTSSQNLPAGPASQKEKRRKSVTKLRDDYGNAYYHDEESGETTWDPPAGVEVISEKESLLRKLADVNAKVEMEDTEAEALKTDEGETGEDSAEVTLSASGWRELKDPATGNSYYWNLETGKTQWTLPVVAAREKVQAVEYGEAVKEAGNRKGNSSGAKARKLWKRASFTTLAAVKLNKHVGRRRRHVIIDEHRDNDGAFVKKTIAKPEKMRKLILNAIRKNFVFSKLSQDTVHDLVDSMAPVAYTSKERITTEGEKGDKYFVIAEGSCSVTVRGRQVAELKRGESFGELALFYKCPRNATVSVLSPTCSLWTVDRATFRGISMNNTEADVKTAVSFFLYFIFNSYVFSACM